MTQKGDLTGSPSVPPPLALRPSTLEIHDTHETSDLSRRSSQSTPIQRPVASARSERRRSNLAEPEGPSSSSPRLPLDLPPSEKDPRTSESTVQTFHDVSNPASVTHALSNHRRSTITQQQDVRRSTSAEKSMDDGHANERLPLRSQTMNSKRGEPLDLTGSRTGIDWIVPATQTSYNPAEKVN
jgi:hypothetical protein